MNSANLPTSDIRVLVVADDMLVRAGLTALLADQSNLSIIGQVANNTAIAQDIDVYQPDVIIWDFGWEPSDSLEQLADLPEDAPPVLTLLSEKAFASEAWSSGARGILHRNATVEALSAAISALFQGLAIIEPEFATALGTPRDVIPPQLGAELTQRENEVLRNLAEGMSNKSIAYELDISEHTVKFHVTSIMSKLNAQSRTEAVVNATRLGLIPL